MILSYYVVPCGLYGRKYVLATPRTSVATTLPLRQWPVPWFRSCEEWLGECEFELPPGLWCSGLHLLGIMSSHRSRFEPLSAAWERALESALGIAKRAQLTVFFASCTPYADRLRHACDRFGLQGLELRFRDEEKVDESGVATLRYSGNPLPHRSSIADIPIEDRAIAILSHQLFVLKARRGGKIARLIEMRLREESMTSGSTLLAVRQGSGRRAGNATARGLSERGAVLWIPKDSASDDCETTVGLKAWGCRHRPFPPTQMPFGRSSSSLLDSDEFLVHFTRGRGGSWPDQSISQLYDEAIRLEWSGENSPLLSLQRILVTQRLFASSQLRRGPIRTVCFTARSIQSALNLRAFQSHLGRWDWEPYGIAIRRTWLAARGARPVQYAHPDEIHHMPISQQAFAQPLPVDDRHRDWSIEQEWRIQDDVRLSSIPPDQAFLFVRTRQDAKLMSPWSRWPIVYIDRDER